MNDPDALITSLKAAVQAAPGDVPLRVHLATLLADAGEDVSAVRHAAAALHAAPEDPDARALMLRLLRGESGARRAPGLVAGGVGLQPPPGLSRARSAPPVRTAPAPGDAATTSQSAPARPDASPVAPATPPTVTGSADVAASQPPQDPVPRTRRERREALQREALEDAARTQQVARMFAEAEELPPIESVRRVVGAEGPDQAEFSGTPRYEEGGERADGDEGRPRVRPPQEAGDFVPLAPAAPPEASRQAEPHVRLADVSGMDVTKADLEATLLRPLRRPGVRGLYRDGLRGGVLLYGPPGAGKSFLADAIAGELEAAFLPVDLRRHVAAGGGELAAALHLARSIQPVLVCLDDVEVLGGRTGEAGRAALRVVDEFLAGVGDLAGPPGERSGVGVVATTTAPWDVDSHLRRHGRFERSMLVTTPDQAAREVLLRGFLRTAGVPADGLAELAMRTEGFSSADLAATVELAVDRKAESDGVPRHSAAARVGADDLDRARFDVTPEADAWFAEAGRRAQESATDPLYAGLLEYLRGRGGA